MTQLIAISSQTTLPDSVGNKALSLGWLSKAGVPTPKSWALPWSAFTAWLETGSVNPGWIAGLDPAGNYAVRSSANFEDDPNFAFAGQFDSVLNVQGEQALLDAIETVYRSAQTDLVQGYLEKSNLKATDLKMGVLIQEMVTPIVSGVAFSRNPLTGFNETVVEAVEGSGEALVQGGVNPWRWVQKWGGWTTRPESAPITDELIGTVVDQTIQLAEKYGQPVDIEWVYNGQTVNFVQIRPITTLEKLNIYSNRISKEVLPGIIKPLVWTVNIPLVNTAWIKIFTELIGPNDITPDELTKAIHYRAYFNMGTIGKIFTSLGMPEETLELIMGLEGGDQRPSFRPSMKIVRHIPRMIRFAWSKYRYASTIERELPRLQAYYREKSNEPVPATEIALLNDIDELFENTVDMAYLNIVGPVLANVYGGMWNSQLKKLEIDPAEFDIKGKDAAFAEYNPNVYLAQLHDYYLKESAEAKEAIDQGNLEQARQLASPKYIQAFDSFLYNFGHLSDSGNDFSYSPWRETPELVLTMSSNFAGANHDRQTVTPETLPKLSGRARRALKRARTFQLYREQISSTYIFGYGLMRDRFLALGRAFVGRGLLETPDDIFLLTLAEVRERIRDGADAESAADLVQTRAQEILDVEPAIMPELVLGDEMPPIETATLSDENTLEGIPTSRGYYQGPARVIRQLSDFSKLSKGDVLVIPFSDVSWTPLFAQAGAVIAESGGMLSHSSIVAREYNLPAVVSVYGATHQLVDGEIVSVNGYNGTIILHRDVDDSASYENGEK